MQRRLSLVVPIAIAAACGGMTVDENALPDGGAPLDGGSGGVKDAASDAPHDAKDATTDYVDPGCPDTGPPTMDFACNPVASVSGCGPGEMCSPFAQYPSAGCAQESYGAMCIPSGSGTQGDTCDFGCQPHFTCVVSGQGAQCIRLCDLTAASPCPSGLVCEPIDVPGIGGCI